MELLMNANTDRTIAYFSMEIALEPDMPTYSGGLGVLAGDTVRGAADLGIPMLAVTLAHRKGYFRQKLDASGWQNEEPVHWKLENYLEELPQRATVDVEGRTVAIRAWKYEIVGSGGAVVPVYFLDTDLPENSKWDRSLTDSLYGGDSHYRLCQEVVLGIGGVRMLRALGIQNVTRYHMNEGHSSLLTLELLDEEAKKAGRPQFTHEEVLRVRPLCVFTTHTPVPAGHDQFPMDLVIQVLGRKEIYDMKEVFCCEGVLNMTFLGFNLSGFINGVAKKHAETSQKMFPRYSIDSITNGVHAGSWVAPAFERLFDEYLPGWRNDNASLRFALSLPAREVWEAHQQEKQALIDSIRTETGDDFNLETFTIGFARRATPYKRTDLFFQDLDRLKNISASAGKMQIVLAGKAHPEDQAGKELIQQIFQSREALAGHVGVVYLADYDTSLAKRITSGVDLWLNTPEPPLEASGTSGMKAALNGIPSLSVLDGWWIEGHIEGVTGWSIGERGLEEAQARSSVAATLYGKLEWLILPLFYRQRDRFLEVMLHSIALNGSFFNTQRMLQQYTLKAYYG